MLFLCKSIGGLPLTFLFVCRKAAQALSGLGFGECAAAKGRKEGRKKTSSYWSRSPRLGRFGASSILPLQAPAPAPAPGRGEIHSSSPLLSFPTFEALVALHTDVPGAIYLASLEPASSFTMGCRSRARPSPRQATMNDSPPQAKPGEREYYTHDSPIPASENHKRAPTHTHTQTGR